MRELKRVLIPTSALILLFAFWQILALTVLKDSDVFPTPYDVLKALFIDIPSNELLTNSLASLRRVSIGFLLSLFFGVNLGLLLGIMGNVGSYLSRIIEFFRPISPLAWIPIAILWFGIGENSSYFIIFIAGFFPIFTNSFEGARSINRTHRIIAKSFNISNKLYFKHVIIPSALPQIISGIRIGLGFCWMSVIASEMIAAQSGLGYMIQLKRLLLLSDQVIAGMIVIGIIGYFMNWCAEYLGRVLTPWTRNI